MVVLRDEIVFDDDLWEAIRPDESTWTVIDGGLVVQLSKVPLEPPERNNWPRCGVSEPHKHDKEHRAKLALRETRQQAHAEAARQAAVERGARLAQLDAEPCEDPETECPEDEMPELEDDMPELEDYDPVEESNMGQPKKTEDDEEGDSEEDETCAQVSPPSGKHRNRGATTGTFAELQRRRHEESVQEDERWKKGTSAEVWGKKEHRPKGLGPIPLAEAVRRGLVPKDGYPQMSSG